MSRIQPTLELTTHGHEFSLLCSLLALFLCSLVLVDLLLKIVYNGNLLWASTLLSIMKYGGLTFTHWLYLKAMMKGYMKWSTRLPPLSCSQPKERREKQQTFSLHAGSEVGPAYSTNILVAKMLPHFFPHFFPHCLSHPVSMLRKIFPSSCYIIFLSISRPLQSPALQLPLAFFPLGFIFFL